ncbi:MAG: NUDIX domain-containing protein [Candidatus Aenigmarchaeota archaeon]|nr:NUDIX domain-containing protein [Candidatus Aenigmarchaeota archaeon]
MPKIGPGVGVAAMIVKDGNVLLGKRHDDPEKADSLMHGEGTWTMPGGKLDFGEGLINGVCREVSEETSLELDKEKIKLFSIGNEIVHDAHFITLGFLSKDFQGEAEIMEPDEITEWRWFPLDSPPEPMFPPAEKMLKNYLDKELYKH